MGEFIPIKETLNKHMPIIIEIIGDQQFSWPNRQLNTHLQNRQDAFVDTNGNLRVEVNFYDILEYAQAGNMQARGMFDYLSQILVSLCKILKEHKTKLRPVVNNLLTNLDYKYLNLSES